MLQKTYLEETVKRRTDNTKANRKGTNNNLQNIIQKTKDRAL